MKTPIVILHGWKKRGSDYHELQKFLESKGFTVLAPDMPGFGDQPLTKPVMVLDDYVDFVYKYVKKQSLSKVILLGHSFGGRVAAKFCKTYPAMVEKLIITGSPLIKRKLSFKRNIASRVAKVGKASLSFLPYSLQNLLRRILYRSIGEYDYMKSGELRKTFVNIINEDVSPVLPYISAPTLLVWGEDETFVPVVDGKEIARRIHDSKFMLIKNAGHRLPYENPHEFALAVLSFLR